MNANERPQGVRKFGKNLLIFSIGSFASKLLGYLLLPFYTHVLSQEEYGVFDIVVTTVNLLFPLLTLMITEATLRFALDAGTDARKVFTLSAAVAGAGLAVGLALSPLLLLTVYRAYYPFFLLYYVCYTVYTLFSQFAKGTQRTQAFAMGGILAAAVTVLFNILLLAVFPLGLTGYFLASFAGLFAASCYLLFRCRLARALCRLSRADLPLLGAMLRYSLPIMPNAVSWWVSTSSDKYVIGHLYGVSETGLYAAAYKLPSLLTVFTSVFLGAWQISAVEQFGTPHSARLFSRVYRLFFACLLTATAAVIAFAEWGTSLLFAEKFHAAWRFVPLLMLAYLFHDLAAFHGSVYTAAKRTSMLFWSTAAGALVNLALNLWLIPRHGAIAGAFTTCVSYGLVWFVRWIDTRKLLLFPRRWVLNGCSLLLVTAETAVATWQPPHAFLIGVALFAAVFALQAGALWQAVQSVFAYLRARRRAN